MITVRPKHPVKRIGVVSDTHIPTRGKILPPALFRLLAGVDLILHAGDLVCAAVLKSCALPRWKRWRATWIPGAA